MNSPDVRQIEEVLNCCKAWAQSVDIMVQISDADNGNDSVMLRTAIGKVEEAAQQLYQACTSAWGNQS